MALLWEMQNILFILPTYGNIIDTHQAYKSSSLNYSPDCAYWMIFRSVATLAELDREKFGASVREYWTQYQQNLIDNQQKSGSESIRTVCTKVHNKAAQYTTKTKVLL